MAFKEYLMKMSNGMNHLDSAMPRRRERAVSGITVCWNILHSNLPISKIHSPQSSNGSSNVGTDTASLLSSDSRLGQPPVIDLICARLNGYPTAPY